MTALFSRIADKYRLRGMAYMLPAVGLGLGTVALQVRSEMQKRTPVVAEYVATSAARDSLDDMLQTTTLGKDSTELYNVNAAQQAAATRAYSLYFTPPVEAFRNSLSGRNYLFLATLAAGYYSLLRYRREKKENQQRNIPRSRLD